MKKLFITFTFLAGVSVAAYGQTAINLTGYTDYSDGEWVLGFEFSPVNNISVTALGSFFPGGATDQHSVGIWNAAQVELASANVTGTGTEGFDYTAITPLVLTAGTDYVIGATTLNDDYADQSATFTVNPGINYIQHVELSSATLAYPTLVQSFSDFGANFQFTAVPEPGSMTILTAGALVGLGLFRRLKS